MIGQGRMAPASRCALAVGVLTALAFGGCTTTTASPASSTGKVTPAPGPAMTGIAEAAQCTIHEGAKAGLPALREKDVFPTAGTVTWSPPDVNSLGPDGGDLERCPGELPRYLSCEGTAPWAGLDQDRFLTASGAKRDVQQELGAFPADAKILGADTPGARVSAYRYLDLPSEDTRDVRGYLRRAFTQCAHAKLVPTVAGVTALRGSTWDVDPKVTTECVLLMTDRRVGWLLLEGSGWTSADRQRALQAVAKYTATTPSR